MKDPNFYFDPKGGWHACHGDGKATTDGMFSAQTQTTVRLPQPEWTDTTNSSWTDADPKYRVQVWHAKSNYVALGPIILGKVADGAVPSDQDVLEVLREAVGLPTN